MKFQSTLGIWSLVWVNFGGTCICEFLFRDTKVSKYFKGFWIPVAPFQGLFIKGTCTYAIRTKIGRFRPNFRTRGYKTFCVLNSTEHKFQLLIQTSITTNEEVSCFKSHRSHRCCIVMSIVGILTFMSRINMCSAELSMK